MKHFKIIISTISIIGFSYILIACNNNKDNNATNNQTNYTTVVKPISDTIPEIIEDDTLIEEYIVKVVDTFDNGNPLKINYCNPNNPNEVKYEKQFYQSGKLFIEGGLDNELRTGKWVAWYENGVIWSIGYFEKGLKNGASNVYYDNGQIRYTKNYVNDVAEGLWEFFDQDGNLLGKVMYENGEIAWQEGVSE